MGKKKERPSAEPRRPKEVYAEVTLCKSVCRRHTRPIHSARSDSLTVVQYTGLRQFREISRGVWIE